MLPSTPDKPTASVPNFLSAARISVLIFPAKIIFAISSVSSSVTRRPFRELVERLGVPFPILSDEQLVLARAMRLPTMDIAGFRLLKRLAWIARDGLIERVFYPVFPPDRNAGVVLAALRANA